MKKKVIFLVGPTGSGKTDISIKLAKKIKAEIISADSMNVYIGMDIGTAKPSLLQRKQVPHYLIDIISSKDNFSAADFSKRAKELIADITTKGKIPLLVGGSGLYIKALVDGLFPDTGADWEIRKRLQKEANKYGKPFLYDKLKQVDAISAEKIHPNDLRRIIRALEVYEKTGVNISERRKATKGIKQYYNIKMIGILRDRKQLYADIEKRVDKMFKDGLIEEVKNVLKIGMGDTAKKALGYKEIIAYLNGESELEQTKELIKKNTKRYAKRQMTWFRADKRIEWVNFENDESIEDVVKKIEV